MSGDSRFGIAFAQRLGFRLLTDGWRKSTKGHNNLDEFWTEESAEGPVHRVWVTGHEYPRLVKIRLYMTSTLVREAVQKAFAAGSGLLPGLVLSFPRRNGHSKKHSRCGYSLEAMVTGEHLSAAGLNDGVAVADLFYERIEAAMSALD